MMKIFTAPTLLALLTLSVFAQQQGDSPGVSTEGSPDIQVLGVTLWPKDTPTRVTFAIRIKNNGQKTVKAITWEHLLLIPSGDNKVNITLELKSGDLHLRPDQTQTVLSWIDNVLDPQVSGTPPKKVRLTKVEYVDGAPWRRSDSEAK